MRTQIARNAEQTAKMVCGISVLSIDPVTPGETRVTLGLKEPGKVNY